MADLIVTMMHQLHKGQQPKPGDIDQVLDALQNCDDIYTCTSAPLVTVVSTCKGSRFRCHVDHMM